ncbi:hypothetical protein HFO56_24435 [Rhizobium laguerreae]|uniref:hypothetical protein n=1 Tax=Rhizobium laguerreae TaxID=1076926 RepID=UPI001C91309E|nr:hypothetical protein [Rhizobium laguerreae]MBY3155479.1 hypothetical protein [Rhizobium laguerreae]
MVFAFGSPATADLPGAIDGGVDFPHGTLTISEARWRPTMSDKEKEYLEHYDHNRFSTIVRSSSPRRADLIAKEFGRMVMRLANTLPVPAAKVLRWTTDPAEFPAFAATKLDVRCIVVGVACVGEEFAYGVAIKENSSDILIISFANKKPARISKTIEPDRYAPALLANDIVGAVAHLVAKAELAEPWQLGN